MSDTPEDQQITKQVLDAGRPSILLEVKLDSRAAKNRFLQAARDYSDTLGLEERKPRGFKAQKNRAPIYANRAYILAPFIMDVHPDESKHYARMTLTAASDSSAPNDLESRGDELKAFLEKALFSPPEIEFDEEAEDGETTDQESQSEEKNGKKDEKSKKGSGLKLRQSNS